MSTLKLSLDKAHLGSEIMNGVVARVQRFAPSSGSGGKNERPGTMVRDLVIPAGRETTASLDVEPGRYRIQAFLPSGKVLQEDREIVAEEEVIVRFEPESSIREWLSWQRFEGNEPDARALTTAAPIRRSRSARVNRSIRSILGDIPKVSRHATALDATGLGYLVTILASALVDKVSLIPDLVRGRERGATLSPLSQLAEFSAEALWAGLTSAEDPLVYFHRSGPQDEQHGTAAQVERKQHEGSVALWQVTRPGPYDSPPAWLLLEAADSIEIARLPLPWLDTSRGQFVEAEALVDESPSRSGARLSLTVRDSTLGGLLAYLSRGCTPAARVLLNSLDQQGLITQTIAKKGANQLAACAAAYAGLALFEPEERERWDRWLPNIMNWYGWLPDGAIVHARRMILRPYKADDRKEALNALKTAYRAGIPYFSAGVQHLRDGLFLYAPRDEEAKAMLDTVSRLARRIDIGQVFTVIRYPNS
jgi:hypothetical protein